MCREVCNLTVWRVTINLEVSNLQEWVRLHESHSKDIKVNWPDGHFTTGIDRHIEDLKAI